MDLLVDRSYQVTCTVRQTSTLRWLETQLAGKSPPIQLVATDLNDPTVSLPSLRGVDIAIHLAGLTKAFGADDYYRTHAEATRHLLDACAAKNGSMVRFLYWSSLVACGPSPGGRQASEDTQANPPTNYGRSKLKGEMVVREYATRLTVPLSVHLRFTALAERIFNILAGKKGSCRLSAIQGRN